MPPLTSCATQSVVPPRSSGASRADLLGHWVYSSARIRELHDSCNLISVHQQLESHRGRKTSPWVLAAQQGWLPGCCIDLKRASLRASERRDGLMNSSVGLTADAAAEQRIPLGAALIISCKRYPPAHIDTHGKRYFVIIPL